MRLRVVSVGKPRSRELNLLYEDYAERVRRLGIAWETAVVREVAAGGRYSDDHVREREGRDLLAARAGRGVTVAVDRGGRLYTTERFAGLLTRWASPTATFLVGGPLGLHRAVLEDSDAVWSLSPLTFPHELARVLVAEQIYRAVTLIRGVPYHR